MEDINTVTYKACNTMGKRCKLVYFSGTGGTARAAAYMEQALITCGVEVLKVALDKQVINPESQTMNAYEHPFDLLILLFAVHAFDAPEPVYNWVRGLSENKNATAAVISVSGGGEVWPNTACRMGCIRMLERKGYDVFYERMLIMPSNWIMATEDHLAMELLKVLPMKTKHAVSEILSGVHRRNRSPMSSRMMTALFKLEKIGARFFAKDLSVSESCSGCGWCARSCPRKNIRIENGKPVFDWHCIVCLRCLYGCPSAALHSRLFRFISVKGGYNLNALEARADGFILKKPVEELAVGAYSGLREYLLKMEA